MINDSPRPTKSQAAQILAQRHAAIRWSTDADRAEWKQEAAAGIAAAAEAKEAEFDRYMRQLTESSEEYSSRTEGGWM